MTDSLTDVAPVPSISNRRRDGWPPERQGAFLAALAQVGLVSAAAKAVGMSRKAACALLARARPGSSFAEAWHEAQPLGPANRDPARR
jgi:hypothetical protein